MKDWWMGLEQRERQLLSIGGIVGFVLLYFLLVWEPLAKNLKTQTAALSESRDLLSFLVGVQQQMPKSARSGASRNSRSRSLLSVVDSAAKSSGLGEAVSRIQPDGDTTVRVWVEGAPLNDLLNWINALSQTHQIQVKTANIERGEVNGTAKARLTLER